MEPRQDAMPSRQESAPNLGQESSFDTNNIGVKNEREHSSELSGAEIGDVRAEATQIAMPSLPTPVIVDDQSDNTATLSTTPSTANDDDLIEKEWVDRIKKVLEDTKDDPYRREVEINKMQIEYIRLRYGRQVGNAGDQ